MNTDNWQHRAKTMLCQTCMWFVPKGEGIVGRCRKKAPTLGGWPVMYPTDFCGDHKLDEGRVQEPVADPSQLADLVSRKT